MLPRSSGLAQEASASAPPPELRHRMGVLVVRTSPGARVTVRQLAHEFWFGTAIAEGIFSAPDTSPDKARYLAVLKENFNSAVHENAMKWYSTETAQGKVSYEKADAVLQWCTKNGLRMRGHCVYWEVENYVQDWVKRLEETALRRALEARARDLLTRYRGAIGEFDLNNEMLHGDFYAKRLGPSIHLEMFRWCQQANPEAVLYVNDYGVLSGDDLPRYEKQIESLLAQKAPVGGIGLQGHFGARVDPEKVKRVLDSLSRFRLPIKITEFDMKTLDEAAKAQGLKDLYRVCFEHPAVDGILMWGFWAKAHWLSSKQFGIAGYTALWDKDWNPMPAAQAYRDLVFRTWWTDFEGTADATGRCEVAAFLGRHRVAVPGAETVVQLGRSEPRKEVTLPAKDPPDPRPVR